MLKEERHQQIIELTKKKNFIKYDEFCTLLNVSKATIKRDLEELNNEKQIQLTRGGAISLKYGTTQELPYNLKKDANYEEKTRIADYAVKYINEGETIFLDSSTTVLQMTSQIKKYNNLTIATNDLTTALEIAKINKFNLHMIGGLVRRDFFTCTGCFTEYMLKNICVDKAFIGVDAVNINRGLMITNVEEISIKRNIINSAKETIILCDHSKFESSAFMNICSLIEVNRIVTGKELDDKILKQFIEQKINIELV